MPQQRFTDYPELSLEWNRRLCTVAKNLPYRLAIYSTSPQAACGIDEERAFTMRNPYLSVDRNIYLTGYFPIVTFEEKGALKLKKGHVSVLTVANTDLIKKFGTQLEHPYHCVVLDLSSEQIRSSGTIETWTVVSPGDVEMVFIVNSPPVNYFEFIRQAIDTPRPVTVRT